MAQAVAAQPALSATAASQRMQRRHSTHRWRRNVGSVLDWRSGLRLDGLTTLRPLAAMGPNFRPVKLVVESLAGAKEAKGGWEDRTGPFLRHCLHSRRSVRLDPLPGASVRPLRR